MTAPRVLVIDDEPTIGELIALILQREKIDVEVAQRGEEGLAKCRQWRPDALVLDLMLPDIDGYEICRQIKADPNTAGARVLMLTALQGHVDRQHGFAVGADAFLTKPFTPDVLLAELRLLLGQSTNNEPGLRRGVQFDFADEARHKKQVLALLEALVRSSPMSPKEIDAVAAALLALGKLAFRRRQQTPAADEFSLSCQVFADRLEHQLQLANSDGAAGPDAYCQLFGVADITLPIPNTAALGQSSFHADGQRSCLVFSRDYSSKSG